MELIDELLHRLPKAKLASGRREIACRCMYCGDSKKDSNKRSMYISVPQGEDDLMFYNCFRADCGAKGILTEETLLDWGIYDKDMLVSISNHNNKAYKLSKNKKYKINNRKIYPIHNKMISENKVTEYKLDYINNRLGTSFNYNDITNFKIVLNLGDLLKSNGIQDMTRHVETMKSLHKEYIGFLNVDNGLVNLRNVNPKSKRMRYVNYTIFQDSEPLRFYVLPTTVDNRYEANIHIAEGVFDILSVYENMNRKSIPNSIFASVFGASYYKVMRWFILESGLRHMVFHIYVDNDVPYNTISAIKKLAETSNFKTYIHKNEHPGEKDFGVRKEKITEIVRRVY